MNTHEEQDGSGAVTLLWWHPDDDGPRCAEVRVAGPGRLEVLEVLRGGTLPDYVKSRIDAGIEVSARNIAPHGWHALRVDLAVNGWGRRTPAEALAAWDLVQRDRDRAAALTAAIPVLDEAIANAGAGDDDGADAGIHGAVMAFGGGAAHGVRDASLRLRVLRSLARDLDVTARKSAADLKEWLSGSEDE